MNNSISSKRSALKFFLLVFIISAPFWLIGDIAEQKLPLPFNLPVGALVLVCPMIAALTLIYRENGSDGVKQLLKRPFDFKKIKRKIWYIPIFFLMPCIIVLEYGLMKLMGVSIPNFQFPVLMVPVFFVIFFIGGIGEEIGWTGYVCYEFLLSGFTTIPEKAYSQRSHFMLWSMLVNWFFFPFTVHIMIQSLPLSLWQSRL